MFNTKYLLLCGISQTIQDNKNITKKLVFTMDFISDSKIYETMKNSEHDRHQIKYINIIKKKN